MDEKYGPGDPVVNYLLVDDKPENLHALEAILKRPGVRIFSAQSGSEALHYLLDNDFAVALVDVHMPQMDGFELAQLMRGKSKTRQVPIIFMTAEDPGNRHLSFEGYEAGAVDFLYKPLNAQIVRNKVQVFYELHLQRKKLEAALDARQAFASIVSHELRTPMSAITLMADVIDAHTKDPQRDINAQRDEIRKAAASMKKSAANLNSMVEALLEATRLEIRNFPINPRLIDFSAEARRVLDVHGKRLGDQEGLVLDVCLEDGIAVEVDPARMEQVIVNLLTNAAKYGGDENVEVTLRREGHDATLVIRDHGPGVPAEAREEIFDKYVRIRHSGNASDGLGLGLHIVREIIRAHGGNVEVQSEEGAGAAFIVRVPLAGREQEDSPGA